MNNNYFKFAELLSYSFLGLNNNVTSKVLALRTTNPDLIPDT